MRTTRVAGTTNGRTVARFVEPASGDEATDAHVGRGGVDGLGGRPLSLIVQRRLTGLPTDAGAAMPAVRARLGLDP